MEKTGTALSQFDRNALLWIQTYLRGPFWNRMMCFFSMLGNGGAIWILSSALMLLSNRTRNSAWTVLIAQVFGLVLTNLVLKNLFSRKRPFQEEETLVPLIKLPTDGSFPSGHTTSSISAGIILLATMPTLFGVSAMILAFLISFSRMFVGVHYPTDILGGAASGTLSAFLAMQVVSRFF